MELKVITAEGRDDGTVTVSDDAFGAPFNEALIHQVVTAYQAGGRAGTKAQRNRSAVRGGGSKPYRQKGTGRARAGTIRSPLWRGGGATFAAQPRSYDQKVNRKMYRGAMRSIFSELVRQERLKLFNSFTLPEPKTKELAATLSGLDAANALIVQLTADENVVRSARNLVHVSVAMADTVDPVGLIGHDKVLMTVDALKRIEERLQ